ncbi:MAG: hypothetical protein WDL87_09380 [Candidatus Omnitrophota bacterium]
MAMKVQEIAREIGWFFPLLAIVILVFSFSHGRKPEEKFVYELSYGELLNACRYLDRYADINAKNEFGATMMMVKLLLEKGVDINVKNKQGRTVLRIVKERRYFLDFELFKRRMYYFWCSFQKNISNFYDDYLNVFAKRKRCSVEYSYNEIELFYRDLLVFNMLKEGKQGESPWK